MGSQKKQKKYRFEWEFFLQTKITHTLSMVMKYELFYLIQQTLMVDMIP